MGIQGVEAPKKEEAKPAVKVGEKVVSAVSEAVDAAKTMIADTDDIEGHQEL